MTKDLSITLNIVKMICKPAIANIYNVGFIARVMDVNSGDGLRTVM
jgi:hypothetical protein